MAQPYFATGYVRLLYRFVRAEVPEKALFQGTGCTERHLMRAEFEMPFSAQMRLVENALANAAPGLGLRVGHQLQLAAHGVVGTAMQSAPDLDTALDTFARFVPVRASFFVVTLSNAGRAATISIAVHGLPTKLVPFFSESILFTLTHCLTYYSGRQDNVRQLQLAYAAPAYHAAYAPVFGGPVEFGCAETRIGFETSLLSLPSPEADVMTFEESLRRCRTLMEERQEQDDIVQNIENFLLENPGKLWTLEEIAPLFAVSGRTLIRQLKRSGTSYQTLRDKALKQQAVIYLGSMTAEAAALSLGFADTSSFRRTFKRWFGMTPSEYLVQVGVPEHGKRARPRRKRAAVTRSVYGG